MRRDTFTQRVSESGNLPRWVMVKGVFVPVFPHCRGVVTYGLPVREAIFIRLFLKHLFSESQNLFIHL